MHDPSSLIHQSRRGERSRWLSVEDDFALNSLVGDENHRSLCPVDGGNSSRSSEAQGVSGGGCRGCNSEHNAQGAGGGPEVDDGVTDMFRSPGTDDFFLRSEEVLVALQVRA